MIPAPDGKTIAFTPELAAQIVASQAARKLAYLRDDVTWEIERLLSAMGLDEPENSRVRLDLFHALDAALLRDIAARISQPL